MNGYYTLPAAVAAAAMDLTRALCTKSDAFSLVVGKVLAYEGAINTTVSCNDNIVAYTGSALDAKLGMLVNVIPLNTNKIRDYVKRYVKWRYDQAVGVHIASYGREGSETEDFFAISHYFDKESIQLTKDNPAALARYEIKVMAIHAALTTMKDDEVSNG